MAPEIEEVVRGADPGGAEHLDPDCGEPLLEGGGRDYGLGVGLGARLGGSGEGPAIELAVGGARELVEEHERRWDHVGRRIGLERPAQLGGGGFGGGGHHVGAEARVAGPVLAHRDRCVADLGHLAERRLDLLPARCDSPGA